MPRNKRIEVEGGIYHVITRGIERREIFKDDKDREEFLRRLSEAIKVTGSQCYGWALMPNHFHLIMRSIKRPLNELMRKVLTGYAIYFNHRHKRHGYLYQNRYKSILCQEEVYLLELIRYVHLNPLRGGIVKDICELGKYKWAGHSALIGRLERSWQEVDEVLIRFGREKEKAAHKLIKFMEDGIKLGKRDDLTGGGLRRSAGGWSGVFELRRAKEYWRGDERILGDGDFVDSILKGSEEEINKKERLRREGWNIERLIEYVCKEVGVTRKELKKKGRKNKVSEAKALIVYLGIRELRITGSEIGKAIGCARPSVSYLLKIGEDKFSDRKLL